MFNAGYANNKADASLKTLRVYMPLLRHILHAVLSIPLVINIVYKCMIKK